MDKGTIMAKQISESYYEKIETIKKLQELDRDTSSIYYGKIKNDTPPQAPLRKTCRGKNYGEITLDCLQYLWLLSKKVSIDVRLKSKVAYLYRVDDGNHPRKDKYFTLEESNNIDERDESRMLMEIYKTEMDVIHREKKFNAMVNNEDDEWNNNNLNIIK